MPDEPTNEPTNEPAKEPEKAPENEPTNEPKDPASEDTGGLDLEAARAALAKARNEAASYRTRLRDTEEKLGKAKTPEEYEALRVELTEASTKAERTLVVENVALKFKLPEELASVLKGNTREELEAHAEVLAKYAPASEPEPTDDPVLSGGLKPGSKPEAGADDLTKVMTQLRTRRY